MKRFKQFLLFTLIILSLSLINVFGCTLREANQSAHECESVCGKCGGCLNAECGEEACANKCTCEEIPPEPAHECESVCEKCGGCLNAECGEEACANKCTCEEIPPEPAHECQSVCEKCGGCLNAECKEEACANKCTCEEMPPEPAHECESVCEKCGGCLNAECKEEACANKCTCEEEPPVPPDPEKKTYTVTFLASEGGKISGQIVQVVEEGGDCSRVTAIANKGYMFAGWSDGGDYKMVPHKTVTDVTQDMTFTANFEIQSYSYRYIVYFYNYDSEGAISDGVETSNEIVLTVYDKNETFPAVTAVAGEGYMFERWSDGVTTATRQDKFDITQASCYVITVYAYFKPAYTITYIVDKNLGGRIEGDLAHTVISGGSTSSAVKAIANEGFIFTGWSDMLEDAERQEVNVTESIEYVAFFEYIEKTLKYNFNGATQPLQTFITLNRYSLTDVTFIVPEREGYTFCGWYIDSDFKMKIANETGKYFLGLLPFSMTETEIYSKWQKNNEEQTTPVYKVLLVMDDELTGHLWSSVTQDYIDMHYKMSAVEREVLKWVSIEFSEYLNEWFNGSVIFDVDTYFTRETITKKSKSPHNWDGVNKLKYFTDVPDIPEVADIYKHYNSYLNFVGYNDFDGLLHEVSVAGTTGYYNGASIYLDWESKGNNYARCFKDLLRRHSYALNILSTAIHEFCHTVEFILTGPSVDNNFYHKTLWGLIGLGIYEDSAGDAECIEYSRLFLLNLANEYGDYRGMPETFWREVWEKNNNFEEGVNNMV